jgi:outer membrane protein assembly factor BamA
LRYFTFLFIFLTGLQVFATQNDSIVSRASLFVIPHPAYQQETNWSAGVAGGYYFKSNDLSRISSISGSADYTLLNQFIFNITPKIYSSDKRWYFYSNLNFKKYPDFYYGIANKPTDIQQTFTSHNFSLRLEPQYAVTENLSIGAIAGTRFERVSTDSTFDAVKEKIFSQFGDEGWSPYSKTHLGFLVSYDTRDSHFYPKKGIFAKTTLSTSIKGWGSLYSMTDLSIDFRQFVPLYKNHIFAWQVFLEGAFSSSEIPFQLRPTLGGRDVMRGFREGMYRDNILMVLQTEYRIPIYKRLKGAMFISSADVLNNRADKIDKLKIAYGAGLRYRLNDARVHLRLDIAKNNYGEKLQFYITATEAF